MAPWTVHRAAAARLHRSFNRTAAQLVQTAPASVDFVLFASTVPISPVVLPLQWLQVIQLIPAPFAYGVPMPDFPSQLAGVVSVALSPNQCTVGINPQRRVLDAGGSLVPDRFNYCRIEGFT